MSTLALVAALVAQAAGARRGARHASPAPRSSDERLRRRVLARLERDASWCADAANVLVADGCVTLQGLFRRRADRAASAALARALPGVRTLVDARVARREWQSLG